MRSENPSGEAKITDKEFNRKMLVPLFVVLISLFCMTYSAWAMFIDSINTDMSLSPTNFNIEATWTSDDDRSGVLAQRDTLSAGTYKITLVAGGSASECSGYAKLNLSNGKENGEESFYSVQMLKGSKSDKAPYSSVEFELTLNESAVVEFSYVWGTYSGEAEIKPDAEIEFGVAPEPEEEESDEPENTDAPEETPTPEETASPEETTAPEESPEPEESPAPETTPETQE